MSTAPESIHQADGPWTVAELHWAVRLIAHELRRSDGNPAYREVLFDSIEGFLDQLVDRLPPPPTLAASLVRSNSVGLSLGVNGQPRLGQQRNESGG